MNDHKIVEQSFYTVEGTAIATRSMGSQVVGKEMTLVVGFDRGMTDSGYPCWTSRSPTHFATVEDAVAGSRLGKSGWDFDDVYDLRIVHHEIRTEIMSNTSLERKL